VSDHSFPDPAVLAFDGGSTKTDALLVSSTGSVLGRARVGPSNHQLVGLEGMIRSLGEAVAAVAEDAHLPDRTVPVCTTGVYCLAGVDLPSDVQLIAAPTNETDRTLSNDLDPDTVLVAGSVKRPKRIIIVELQQAWDPGKLRQWPRYAASK